MTGSTGDLHRLQWLTGHRLGHLDLDDWVMFEPELLGLHVRATHGTWGVAEGLHVARTSDHKSAVISRGFGYDRHGFLVALPTSTSSAPPAGGPSKFVLALRRQGEVGRDCCSTSPPCPASDRPRPPTRVVWHAESAWPAQACCTCADLELPLARFVRGKGGLLSPPDPSVRRAVTPQYRPRIRRGSVAGADLDWLQGGLSLYAWLDTSIAGFDATPSYQISLFGFEPSFPGLIGPWVSTAWSSRLGVRIVISFAAPNGKSAKALLGAVQPSLNAATVAWTGIETSESPAPLRSFPSGGKAWLARVTRQLVRNP